MGLSRFHAKFPERAIAKPPAPSKGRAGVAPTPPKVSERPINWPKPTPTWGTSFNRTMHAPVVKTRVVKHGVD